MLAPPKGFWRDLETAPAYQYFRLGFRNQERCTQLANQPQRYDSPHIGPSPLIHVVEKRLATRECDLIKNHSPLVFIRLLSSNSTLQQAQPRNLESPCSCRKCLGPHFLLQTQTDFQIPMGGPLFVISSSLVYYDIPQLYRHLWFRMLSQGDRKGSR